MKQDIPVYTLIRSDRKTLSLEIRPDASLLVRAPKRLSKARIDAFVSERRAWIATHTEKVRARAASPYRAPLSEEEIRILKDKAAALLPALTEHWAAVMGVSYTGVRITGAEKRFGSCSSENAICYSYRLMRFPDEAIEYVVVHELAHTKYHNHAKEFYRFVARFLPDYKAREAILKQ